ncbi:MAG: DnaA ATPase domain-containing protein, partial [Limisphaerales bacterium]
MTGFSQKDMQLSPEKIWNSAQEHLRSSMSADTFNMWFAPLRATAIDGSHATLEAPNEFCEVWLKDNYLNLLQKAFAAASGRQLQIKFKAAAGTASSLRAPMPTENPVTSPKIKAAERVPTAGEFHFNPKNTFESFVVGNNNNFAYAAALAVAQAPGKSYNPLFLYGGVGLGKTHLLHAIGQHVSIAKKSARVAYVSSEKFTNEYIDGIQNNVLARFRKKYRQTDVLLIDDIQFLAGKERIQ